jgi:hypothetical protein
MNKIRINLSPKKEKDTSVLSQNLNYYTTLATVVFFILIIFLISISLVQLFIYKNYQGKWRVWEGKFSQLNEIKQSIAKFENEKKEFQKLITPENQAAAMLGDLFSSLPKNIWFNNLIFKKNSLSLRGYVVKLGEDYLVSLEKLIASLEKKNYFSSKFSKIKMKESRKTNFNGVEVLEFNIECAN